MEAAQVTVRSDAQWRSQFFHLAMRRGCKIAKVAMARKLAVELYWMWRRGWDYHEMQQLGSSRLRSKRWLGRTEFLPRND